MVSGHIQNLLWGTSFFLLSAIDSFVSPSSLVCCRNATLAAMSAIKISAEEMCFLVAENTSPSKVLASQAGQPPSQECVLSFHSPQNTLEKSPSHGLQSLWIETCSDRRCLRKHIWKCIQPVKNVLLLVFHPLFCFLQANKQRKQRKQWKTQTTQTSRYRRGSVVWP